jgi:hypothetical protein
MFRGIIPVHSENYIKYINILSGQNLKVLNVKAGGTYSNCCALNG